MQSLQQAINDVSCIFQDRLDDLEDMGRRNNLHGVQDAKETWPEIEKNILDIIAHHLALELAPNSIERAHHLGGPCRAQKCREIIAQFGS